MPSSHFGLVKCLDRLYGVDRVAPEKWNLHHLPRQSYSGEQLWESNVYKKIPVFDAKTIRRFWSLVKQDQASECRPYTLSLNADGYGRFRIEKKEYLAHRVAFFLENGTINDELLVLHECDNPPCCEPKHLFQGTHQINRLDCLVKGRIPNIKGIKNPMVKLTEDQVLWVRENYYALTQKQMAAKLNVSQGLISMIINYKTWASI